MTDETNEEYNLYEELQKQSYDDSGMTHVGDIEREDKAYVNQNSADELKTQEELILDNDLFNTDLQGAYRRYMSLTSNAISFTENTNQLILNKSSADSSFNLSERLDYDVKQGVISNEDRIYFNNVQTNDYYNFIKEDLQQRKRDDELMSKASTGQMLVNGFIGGILEDPTTWNIFGGFGVKLGQIAYVTARGIGRLAGSIMAAKTGGLMARGAVEGLRYSTARYIGDRRVTATVAAEEFIAFSVLSGILGGAGRQIRKSQFNGWIKTVTDSIKGTDTYHVIEQIGNDIYTYTAGLWEKKIKQPVTGITKKIIDSSPYLRGMNDDWELVNEVTYHLFNGFVSPKTREQSFFKKLMESENAEGSLSAYEKTHFLAKETWNNVKLEYEETLKEFLKTSEAKEANWTANKFHKTVTEIIENTIIEFTDDGFKTTSHINTHNSYVKKASEILIDHFGELFTNARKYKAIYEYKTAEGVKTKASVLTREINDSLNKGKNIKDILEDPSYIPTNVTSLGYLTRLYDLEKVREYEIKLTKLLINSNILKYGKSYSGKTLLTKATKKAEEQIRDILGTGIADTKYGSELADIFVTKGNPAKKRTVNVVNSLLEDVLVRNPLEIGDTLCHRLAGATAINEKAIKMGYKNWVDLLDKAVLARAEERKTLGIIGTKAAEAFDKETKNKINFMRDCANLILDTYGRDNPNIKKMTSGIKTYNLITDLGAVLISSIPDMAAVMAKTSLSSTFKVFAEQLPFIDKIPFTNSLYKKQTMDKIFSMSETAMATARLFDETYSSNYAFKKTAGGWIKDKFSKTTLLPYWNDYWKKMVRMSHYDSLIDACLNQAEQKNAQFLINNRISKTTADAIASAFNEVGRKDIFGVHIMPLENITNKETKNFLSGHLNAISNQIIVSNNKMNIPFWLQTDMAEALTSYQKYQFDFYNGVVRPMLENREYSNMSIFSISSLLLAGSSKIMYDRVLGKKIDLDDPEFWLDIVEKSNIFGYFLSIPVRAAKGFMAGKGAGDIISRPLATAGKFVQIGRSLLSNKDLTEKQLRTISDSLPFLKLFYITPFTYRGIRSYSKQSYRRLDRDSSL